MRPFLIITLFCLGCQHTKPCAQAELKTPQPLHTGPEIDIPAESNLPPEQAAVPQSHDPFDQLRESVGKHVADLNEAERQKLNELMKDLKDDDPQVQYRAVWKIVHSEDQRMVPAIREALSHPNPDIRHRAVLTLSSMQATESLDDVMALINDPNERVRHASAEYGKRLGYRSNLEEIHALLEQSSFTSHSAAMHLSHTLPDDQAVEMFASFLNHKSHHLRKRAVQSIMNYDRALVQPHTADILALIADSDGWVQSAVQRHLRTLRIMASDAQLEQLAEHAAPEVRELAITIQNERK